MIKEQNQNCTECGKFVLFDKGEYDGRDFIAEGTCECGKKITVIQKNVKMDFSPKQWGIK